MSKNTFFAHGNLKHNGIRYAKGDVVKDLSESEAKRLEAQGIISTDEPSSDPVGDEPRNQSDAAKAEARKNKGQASQEEKDENRPEVGGESFDSGEGSIDGDEGNADGDSESPQEYTVLKKFQRNGEKFKKGETITLTATEAEEVGPEKVELVVSDDSQSDDNDSDSDPSQGL